MTKEEKINTLKAIIQECEEYQGQRKETLFEIIKDLEQESHEDVPDINDGNIYKCSCGYGWDKSKVFRHHFCPNCGKLVDGSIKTELKPYEDCISRKDTLEKFKQTYFDNHTVIRCAELILDALPPVAPQPKIGQWILTPRDKYIDINCSVCGNTRIKDYSYGYSIDELNLDEANDFLSKARINFCEHCGAKMQEAKNDTNDT